MLIYKLLLFHGGYSDRYRSNTERFCAHLIRFLRQLPSSDPRFVPALALIVPTFCWLLALTELRQPQSWQMTLSLNRRSDEGFYVFHNSGLMQMNASQAIT